ncbi:MAG: LptF/LptG family permease [Crocinitomicaceae bacterium]
MFLTKIDKYIIGKFLGTFIFIFFLLMMISMVFDLSEKLSEFIEKGANWLDILTIYYSNFIIYFGFQFVFMINFISVIWFTSKMAQNSEIIPILGTGVSFKRFLRPYFISATLLVLLTLIMYNFVLPPSNKKRLEFEEQYYRASFNLSSGKAQLENGQNILYSRYSGDKNIIYKLTVEQWEANDLKYILSAAQAKADSITKRWTLTNVQYREFGERDDIFQIYDTIDTILPFKLKDIIFRENIVEAMNFSELNAFISSQRQKKSKLVPKYLLDKYNRIAAPFAIYILTFIGVLVSSKKSRSGTGGKLALGIILCVAYIFAMKMATVAALNVGFDPLIATWIPNFIFLVISIFLYRNVTK